MSEMKKLVDLQDAIIQLHNIARLVERDIGPGELSHQIRDAADTIAAYIRYSVV